MEQLNRRHFLQLGALGLGALAMPNRTWSEVAEDPHFFLQILMPGGADASYMWDARPLAMTASGEIQNYLGEDPTAWTGANGGTCWATSVSKPLWAYRDRFSVINGVVMSNVDGHQQNASYYFSGSTFGGESFLPHLNLPRPSYSARILDSLQNGEFGGAALTNLARTVALSPASMGPMAELLGDLPDLEADVALAAHLRARMTWIGQGTGRFSRGAQQMQAGLEDVSRLHRQMLKLPPVREGVDAETQFVEFLAAAFGGSMARSASWTLIENFDTHDAASAKDSRRLFGDTFDSLGRIFKALVETPYDSKRSMMDVTTVVINSEFSRTMRQEQNPIDATGTDHNNLNNSFVIAGKGIRGGLVVGASDYAVSGEVLSGAHLALDARRIKAMGRPFDFTTMRPRADRPAHYSVHDYLNAASVVNTIYSLFAVPPAHLRVLDRTVTTPAPALRGLLA